MSGVFKRFPDNTIPTRGSFQKSRYNFRKTKSGQTALSYIGPAIQSKKPDGFFPEKHILI